MRTMLRITLLASALCFAASQAQADITIGVDFLPPDRTTLQAWAYPRKKGLDFCGRTASAGEEIN